MAGFIGMDVEQVRNLATQLGQKAQTIDEVIATITSTLASTDWKGQDADQFRADWDGNLTTQLRNVAQSLRDTEQRANNNAAEQEQTSSK